MTASIDPHVCDSDIVGQGDSILVRNLAAMWAVDPDFAAALESLGDRPGYAVEPSRDGPPTVAVDTDDGRRIYLHSRFRPTEEARRLIEHADTNEKVVFAVHGFGLGYHVQQLFDGVGDEAVLFVFEPDLLLVRTAFEHRDFTQLINSRRLTFLWSLDKGQLLRRIASAGTMISVGFGYVVHAPSVEAHGAFYRQMEQWIGEYIPYCRTSVSTVLLNGRRTAENLARNLGWYVAAPGVERLKDAYHKKPAIIVSAGPSLRKNKHLLRDAAGKAVIIAVQTTLKPLMEMGVEPQFVTSLDYHDICTRFFEGLPAGLSCELVAEPKASPRVLSLNPGPLSLLGNDFCEAVIREMKVNKPRLRAGATVAHLAYYLAEHMGCDPIIFIGQDLGFSDGLCYTPGTSYEDVWRPELSRFCSVEMKQWEQIVRDRPILRRVPDIAGRPMYTEERLFTYLQQFEKDFSTTHTQIIDATEGGVLKTGARVMKLADALARFCAEPLKAGVGAHPGYRWDLVAKVIESVRIRREESRQVEEISRKTLPLLEEIRDHIEDQPRVNRVIAAVDALRAQMNSLGACYDLITQLAQTSEMRRFRSDRQISAGRLKGLERQRRQVARDVENVRSVAEAAVNFQRLMDDVAEELAAVRIAHTTEQAA